MEMKHNKSIYWVRLDSNVLGMPYQATSTAVGLRVLYLWVTQCDVDANAC